MLKYFSKLYLRLNGWEYKEFLPPESKCVIIAAPHTSMHDFLAGWFFYKSMGGKAFVLIKKEVFFWPLGFVLRRMGAFPVDRKDGIKMFDKVVKQMNEAEHCHLVVTPEGTREKNKNWKKGFYLIAQKANVPLYLTFLDFKKKKLGFIGKFEMTGDFKKDIKDIKEHYRGITAKHPEKFVID